MEVLDKKGLLKRIPWANSPIQILFCGFVLTFATPLCCALFSQKASIDVSSLEPHLQESIKKKDSTITTVYYNKGL